MIKSTRQTDLLRLLDWKRDITVSELCTMLSVSPATVRRDLAELEAKGLLRRAFGGATLNTSFFDQLPLAIRSAEHITEKRRLCVRAAEKYVHSGDTIFIDASTTTYFLSRSLGDYKALTVITNSPSLAVALSEEGVRNFCTGGEMLNFSMALVGAEAATFIGRFHADSFFFSARGYANGEITDSSNAERDVKEAMFARSDRRYFLADSSKNGLVFPYRVARLDELDGMICETETDTNSGE